MTTTGTATRHLLNEQARERILIIDGAMGTQIHATENYRRVVELVQGGAIGNVKDCRIWCSRAPKGGSYLPAAGEAPEHLDWDLWTGPSPCHPYNPG